MDGCLNVSVLNVCEAFDITFLHHIDHVLQYIDHSVTICEHHFYLPRCNIWIWQGCISLSHSWMGGTFLKPVRVVCIILCNHQADSPPCVVWCLIWWFASLEKYCHTGHWMIQYKPNIVVGSVLHLKNPNIFTPECAYDHTWYQMSLQRPGVIKCSTQPYSILI